MLYQAYFWWQNFLGKLNHREEGQGLVEYALILVLVSIAVIVVLGVLGTDVKKIFTDISAELIKRPAP